MSKYRVDRSNISYNNNQKSMICTFTITHVETREKFVFNNIFLAEDNKEAFLVFPATNEKVYINRENELYDMEDEKSINFLNTQKKYI